MEAASSMSPATMPAYKSLLWISLFFLLRYIKPMLLNTCSDKIPAGSIHDLEDLCPRSKFSDFPKHAICLIAS